MAEAAQMQDLFFEAVVKPHRSLSRRGMFFAVGFMLVASLYVTSLMYFLGAFPVIGFNGADLLLALILIRLNVRAARATETITLNQDELKVTRIDARGRREVISLPPYWLNVLLRERAGTVPRLLLAAKGRETEVARQLGEAQKRDLAAALDRALHRWRNPLFLNPQLQEGG